MAEYEFGAGCPEEIIFEPGETVYTFEPSSSEIVVLPVPGPPGPPGSIDDFEAIQDLIDTTITVHVNAPEPHPAYDDIQDLTLILENGLV